MNKQDFAIKTIALNIKIQFAQVKLLKLTNKIIVFYVDCNNYVINVTFNQFRCKTQFSTVTAFP